MKPSPPNRLVDLQALMARAVMRPLTRDDGMQRNWTDGSTTSEVAAQFIKPNDRLDSFDRLQIYNQQYWWRLLGNFAEDFRGLRAVLGERQFDRLAVAYLDHCGSQSWTLRDLGSRLEEFLRAHPALTAPQTELALDMVRVEWARTVAFDEAEKPPHPANKVHDIAPELLRLGLQPYIVLLELNHPIDHLLGKLKQRSEIETGSVSNAVSGVRARARRRLTARPSRSPIYLAVHRHKFSVYYKRLDPEAFRLLCALRKGAPLDKACEIAFRFSLDSPEAMAGKVQSWFAAWMSFGWLTRPPAV
ncbi:MAG TPA: DNA-binding domain-containing protein [Chthoniobacterales bacterium]|nr:DNA-binding domain-containing protein [Chthoniobacterales bacterium]